MTPRAHLLVGQMNALSVGRLVGRSDIIALKGGKLHFHATIGHSFNLSKIQSKYMLITRIYLRKVDNHHGDPGDGNALGNGGTHSYGPGNLVPKHLIYVYTIYIIYNEVEYRTFIIVPT